MRKTLCWVLICLAVSVLLATAATAATTESISYGPVSIPDEKTDWTNTLLFPKFSPTLGTLTRVDLFITGEIKTTLTIINDAASASEGNAKTHVTVTVKDPLNLLSVMPDIYSDAYDYNLPAGGSITSGLLTKSETASGSWTASAILSEFTGFGTIGLNAVTFTETVLANTGGNTCASQVTDANAAGTITYYYQTPEPSSMIALLTGASGLLGMVVRRRRS